MGSPSDGHDRHCERSMTPLERWLAVFRREKPDRVPMDYWANG